MDTTAHTPTDRRAAAEKRATRSLPVATYENIRTLLRVLDCAATATLIAAAIYLSTVLPSPWRLPLGLLAVLNISWLLTMLRSVRSDEHAMLFTLIDIDRWFPRRATLLKQRATERTVVSMSSKMLEIAAKFSAPDALGTWGRLSDLEKATEYLAVEGKALYEMYSTSLLAAEVRVYAHDALDAYESVLTPFAICDTVRRFTAAYHESTITSWQREREPADLTEHGFIEMHLRVQCQSNIDWAILNEYYLVGSPTLDERTTESADDSAATTKQEFFLSWWTFPRERRVDALPFDLVLLRAPYCTIKAHAWSLEARPSDYPVSLAPRAPIVSTESPIEYVSKLWSIAHANKTGTYKTLGRVVSAARKITK